tara:strand:+ start:92 stop:358 length:267 start_codon:yes stop_codon:yes gene_type:complete
MSELEFYTVYKVTDDLGISLYFKNKSGNDGAANFAINLVKAQNSPVEVVACSTPRMATKEMLVEALNRVIILEEVVDTRFVPEGATDG